MNVATTSLTIHEAIKFAVDAHRDQQYGKFKEQKKTPYIFHCMRVMLRLPERSWIVGICHDLKEDCNIVPEGLSEIDAEAIDLLTKRPGEKYEDYITRLCQAEGPAGIIAREVKRADLNENLEHLPPTESGLRERYYRALARLEV